MASAELGSSGTATGSDNMTVEEKVKSKLTTTQGKAGLGLLLLGSLTFIIGFSVPYWVTGEAGIVKGKAGLWSACAGKLCFSLTSIKIDWVQGSQATACLALICVLADYVALYFYIIQGYPKKYLKASIGLAFAAGLLALIAAVIFGTEAADWIRDFKDDLEDASLNWGFVLTIIGGLCFVGAGAGFYSQYSRED